MDGTTRYHIQDLFNENVADIIISTLTKLENKHSISLHDLRNERRLKVPYIREARTELIWKLYQKGVSNEDTAKLLQKSKSLVSVIVIRLREIREITLYCEECGTHLVPERMKALGFDSWNTKVPAGFVVTCEDCENAV